ncbi:MAG: hypothetical protein A2014_02015 [Spirochaetes bacterium GWF1_49_6]|nr:MAG: hypothetical protein A2014_02015 [Spirochaetes bacterium GWF1_49_6]
MPEGIEEVDFEKIADEMSGLYNRGISMSRCDRMKIDYKNKKLELIEDTKWLKFDKDGNIVEEDMDEDKVIKENVKKMMGSILVLGMLARYNDSRYQDLVAFNKIFILDVKVSRTKREPKLYNAIRQHLKEYKDGVFNSIELVTNPYDSGGHNG